VHQQPEATDHGHAHLSGGQWSDAAGADPRASAIASLQLLTVENNRDLTNTLFRCAAVKASYPRSVPSDHLSDDPPFNWVADSSGGASANPNTPGLAYDWSTPANSNPMRAVTADRGHNNHNGTVIVGYFDGHVARIKASRSDSDPDGLEDISTGQISQQAINKAAGDDNIFDAVGDDGNMDVAGRGSATRAWVR